MKPVFPRSKLSVSAENCSLHTDSITPFSKQLTLKETRQLGEQRVEAPVLGEMWGDDCIESHRCEERFPWVLDLLRARISNSFLYVLALLLRAEAIHFRSRTHNQQPQNQPDHTNSAEYIENARPTVTGCQHTRRWHRNYRSSIIARKCNWCHARAFQRRRPPGPHGVYARKCNALEHALNNAHSEEHFEAVLSRQWCEQSEDGSCANAQAENL